MDSVNERAGQIVRFGVLLALAIVPLAMLPSGYQFANLPKLFLLLFSALALCGFLLGRSLSGQSSIPEVPVLLFVLLNWIQLTRSLNPHEASIPVLVLTGSVGLAFGSATLFESERRDQLIRVIAWTSGIVALIGVFESWGVPWAQLRSAGRPSATIGFRNTAATYAVGCLPWCVYVLSRERPLDRISGSVMTAVVILFVLYTRSRGAWLGALVSVGIGGAWYVRHQIKEGARWFTPRGTAQVVAALCVILYLGSLPLSFEDTTASRLDEKKQSIPQTIRSMTVPGGDRDRLKVWANTVEISLDHVLLGVGAGNWSALYPKYDAGEVLHINSAPKRPHNDFLWIASELGLIGIVCFGWIIVSALRSAARSGEAWRIAAACSLVAVTIHSVFSFPREQVAPSLILWLAVAVCTTGHRQATRPVGGVVWGILTIACAFGAGMAARAIRADHQYAGALIAQQSGQTSIQRAAAAASLKNGAFDHRVYVVLGDAQMAQRDYAAAVETYREHLAVQPYLAAAANNLGNALNAIGDYAAAERVLLEQRSVLPNDRSLVRNLSESYRRQGDPTGAIRLYDDLDNLSADDHQNLGLLYAELDSLTLALAHYDTALGLDPELYEVIYSKAGIHLIQGRLEEAIAGYSAYLDTPDPNPTIVRRSRERLRQAYTSLASRRLAAGDGDGAVEALQHRVRLGEMTAKDHHFLALAYGRAGAFGRAEDEARMALRLDGSMKIARLTLANALFSQRKREAFDQYRRFLEDWDGDPKLLEVARQRLSRLER